MDYYRKIAKSIDELKLKLQISALLLKIQQNSDKLNQIKSNVESNYNYIGNLELNVNKIKANNEKITNITGNYMVDFIDNKILNIVYTKYIFKNVAGSNNTYMIYESSLDSYFKKFSYIEFRLKLLFRYNKSRFIGAIKICIKFYDKDGNEIYTYQELLTNSGDNYAEKIYNKNDFTFILNDNYENIYYKIFLMDYDIKKL